VQRLAETVLDPLVLGLPLEPHPEGIERLMPGELPPRQLQHSQALGVNGMRLPARAVRGRGLSEWDDGGEQAGRVSAACEGAAARQASNGLRSRALRHRGLDPDSASLLSETGGHSARPLMVFPGLCRPVHRPNESWRSRYPQAKSCEYKPLGATSSCPAQRPHHRPRTHAVMLNSSGANDQIRMICVHRPTRSA
jgi:hypothetical protein